jgi:molybdopterin/thiamine biosynthesis adenylyltransferase
MMSDELERAISPPAEIARFDYARAFSRNLGLVSPEEQERLRLARVAVAGLGGVGGVHVTTLARMGIGNFHIADFDAFEIHNFNRQAGATMSTLDRPKTLVMAGALRDINPAATVRCFEDGVTEGTVEAFLDGVDVAVDGLDYFAVAARELFYERARARGIPVVTAGPIGLSGALLVFTPGGMSWHDYYSMDLARDEVDKYILFAIGTAPRATQLPYLDRRYVDLAAQKGPSLAPAVQLCAGMVGAETLKLLVKRGPIHAAPCYQQFDAYRCKYVRGRLRWGNRGPLQRLKLALFRWLLERASRDSPGAVLASTAAGARQVRDTPGPRAPPGDRGPRC